MQIENKKTGYLGMCDTIGTDNESNLQERSAVSIVDEDGDFGSEDVREASDTDKEQELGVKSQTFVKAPASRSSFHSRLEYKLPKTEVEDLLKKKWKYQWDVPAFGMPNCKWVGTGECFVEDANINSDCGLKQRLYKHWLDVYGTSGSNDFDSSLQRFFFSLCLGLVTGPSTSLGNSYRDILHCNKKPFYRKGLKEDLAIMDAYIMHCLNHIFRTRDLVTKNDSKVGKHRENSEDELLNGDEFLDHGFTRPKVLILLPFRNIANRFVNRLIQLTPSAYKVNVEHMSRFSDEFGTQDDEDNVNTNDLTGSVSNSKSQNSSKPPDHQALFDGNIDDKFMIGIKFTRPKFNNAIATVSEALGAKIEEAKKDKEKDVDYLSSIEVLIIDHADVIAMQNWTFLTSVLEQMNCIPSKQHGTDIMRIRKWYLDGHARFYRQTIILGCYANPGSPTVLASEFIDKFTKPGMVPINHKTDVI
ncbi:unnamed protein product [Dovyalis caffra]|uniref:UTP25 NTP hydrolase-like domain-containing protein n=1 Tax=Dovyalis caffra TaxID=77055 RepID=A0AAV1RPZ1_9ROSI|nr:unnamed protein product [Dovyalis caffra]